jgi:monoamine oxidase
MRGAAGRERIEATVAIIGGGLSGMAAAHRLAQLGVSDVVVLEAKERVGGRLLNERVGEGDGQVVDVGGQWCGPGHTQLIALAADTAVETFPSYAEGLALWDTPEQLWPYAGPTPELAPRSARALDDAVLALDELAGAVGAIAPWTAPDAVAVDRRTLAEWLDEVVDDEEARTVMELRMTLGFAMPTERVSLLHAASFFAGVGGWSGYGTRLTWRLHGGAQAIPLALAARLGDRVRLATPVRTVDQSTAARVTIGCDAVDVSAQRAIVALSPADCRPIVFTPALPPQRRLLHDLWQAGVQRKVYAVYDEPFWRDAGLSGWSLSMHSAPHMTFDNTSPGGAPGVLAGLMTLVAGPTSRSGHAVLVADPEERRAAVLNEYARRFGPRALEPIRYFETSWSGEPFLAGCVQPAPVRLLTTAGPALREPAGRLHWASTETAERWNGWMEGAAQAGARAAEEAAAQL